MNDLKYFNEFYLFKDFYFMNTFVEFDEKIPIHMTARNINYKMFHRFNELLDDSKFLINKYTGQELSFYVYYDKDLKTDGYALEVNKRFIKITAKNYRAVRYAFATLNNLVEVKDGKVRLPICFIEDEPSFEVRGIVEGFYGPQYTHENIIDLFTFMDKHRINTYMYAPKIDIYHRNQWYLLYPQERIEEFKQYVALAEKYDIDFYYTIAPGYKTEDEPGFQYIDDNDFKRLFKKLDQLIDIGVKNFGLLLDDIDYQLNEENKRVFKRPGNAHAYIVNKVNRYLKERIKDSKFVMCPTEYHQVGHTEYRTDLKNVMDDDVYVYWTGDNVCAEVITKEQAKVTQEAFDKEIFIWDNFPVTDFTRGVRQYMGPIVNRTDRLQDYAKGYFSNPMTHYEISKIAMMTMAHYAWNTSKYDPDKSFEAALKEVGQDFYDKGLDYVMFNYPNMVSHGNLALERKMVETNDKKAIKAYYEKASTSASALLKLNYPIIEELKPWLLRTIKEKEVVDLILEEKVKEKDLLTFLEDIHFSGSELFDMLVKKHNLLTDEQYDELIKKRRGNPWYRIWEDRR